MAPSVARVDVSTLSFDGARVRFRAEVAILLTPSGLHFGEGPMDVLARDALGGPLVAAATVLMRGLTSLAPKAPPSRA
jgi:hypothetical protein